MTEAIAYDITVFCLLGMASLIGLATLAIYDLILYLGSRKENQNLKLQILELEKVIKQQDEAHKQLQCDRICKERVRNVSDNATVTH